MLAEAAHSREWQAANQRYLGATLDLLRALLSRHGASASSSPDAADQTPEASFETLRGSMPSPPALERLGEIFQLSPFELMLVLMCAAPDLDATFGPLFGAAHADAQRTYPTFGLALAVLPDAHWSALTPNGPLRYWRLIEPRTGGSLTEGPLRLDERILHYLAGLNAPDVRLEGLVDDLPAAAELVPSQRAVAERIAAAWSLARERGNPPVVQVCGGDAGTVRAIAAHAAQGLGLTLKVAMVDALSTNPGETAGFARLWARETLLGQHALLLDCHDLEPSATPRSTALNWFLEERPGLVVVATRERRALRCAALTIETGKPSPIEQQALWREALGTAGAELNGRIEGLVAQFNFGPEAIRAASLEVLDGVDRSGDEIAQTVWNACRIQVRPRLEDLADRIDSAESWDDLVLPEAQRQILRDLTAHVRQRAKVYDTWGFAAKGSRGLGITALFAGASGTGKTMAASVIANQLQLDLYRIDLSCVVSKYIGETEKNLARIFDAAEDGGSVLLFDEADALFGKRSEVKDSHDRYANIEVSYLLQRMEAFTGLAVLTTNLKSAIDAAFLRRIRFVVQFPFPDAEHRAEIWRRVFPAATPVADIDYAVLARLNVAGGNIRNIALNAAFLAADAGDSVDMTHLLSAARSEYAKLEKPLTESEFTMWRNGHG